MAKPENPAEASVAARPPRPVQRVRLGAFAEGALAEGPSADGALPGRRSPDQHAVAEQDPAIPSAARHEPVDLEGRAARQLIDDAFDANAFDTARNLEAPIDHPDGFLAEDGFLPDDAFEAEIARAESEMNPELSFSEDDGLDDVDGDVVPPDGDDAAGAAPVAARNPSVEPRPGLAWVRRRPSGSWGQQLSNGSAPSAAAGSRVPKLPVASLERPSTSRVELTPSPVPRVALAPATGAVDISLVPGPHTVGSRNLPTLAAQHLLGRRAPRRPAPAVTLPPPPSREPRSAFTLARDVRSSKGEIVVGLTIGLGVSLLLAGLGQAYLRGDAVADGSAPSELESVTLSSRPDVAPAVASSVGSGAGAPANGEPARSAASSGAHEAAAPSIAARPTGSDGSGARRPAVAAGDGLVAGDAVVLAQAAGTKRLERTPQRATRPRQRASAAATGAIDSSLTPVPPKAVPAAISLPAVSSEPPPAEPPPGASPLTPAESAGLGLDLPL